MRRAVRPSAWLPILVVSAATLMCACLLPVPAHARARSAPAVVFGAGGWSWPSDATLERLHRHGLRTWRVTMSWANVSSRPGQMDFSGYDQLLRAAARHHIEMMVTLTGCPRWACPAGGPPASGAALSGFLQFSREAVRRYGHRGAAWLPGARKPVRYWQVFNEVNGADQWPHPSARSYAYVLRKVSYRIRRTDRHAKIVLAGLGEKMTIWLRTYLPALYRQKGFKKAFDVMAPEGYAVTPRGIPRILRTTRKIMRRYHDSRKPIFVTEMSWSTGGPPFPFTTSEIGQAQRLHASWRMLRACRSRWKVRRVYWFSYTDTQPRGIADYWGFHNGLIEASGRTKPAWHTFLKFLKPKRRGVGRCTAR